ncbi:hypothetical protein K439DRAFT_1636303 [Ramaria rubella]|nr:hypothetical protein K439DRAFT_1636303 [Ramaria rubella]
MIFSLFISWGLLIVTSTLAAPPVLFRRACTAVQSGSLSPNGVSGNFRLANNVLAFDPTNLEGSFDVSLQSCTSTQPSTEGNVVMGATGQCLTVQNATATVGPTVTSIDCTTAADQTIMTWVASQGLLFWTGETTTACPSGLYGYQAVSSSGSPAAIQKAPVSLACSTASDVFGFSLLG